jgi:galactosylceramidase
LADYPEQERRSILDFLFKPSFGANLGELKIEIGGDVNSTCGAEPSHARTREELEHPRKEYFERGYEWWLMNEARARNPDIHFGCLEWGVPGWVGEGRFYSSDNIAYVVGFLEGARRFHGIEFDHVGIWNERPYDLEYIGELRKSLDLHGFNRVKIVAADSCCKAQWSIADDITAKPDLLKIVDAFGGHYPERYDQAPVKPYESDPDLKASGKPIWNSEGGPWKGDWAGFDYLVKMYNRDYIEGRMTKALTWSPVTSHYPSDSMPYSGLMTARTPWSAHFDVEPSIWAAAHTTQFVKPGWRYDDGACGYLQQGGSFVSLFDPKDPKAVSVILETIDATVRQQLRIGMPKGTEVARVAIWRTISGSESFVHLPDLRLTAGFLTLDLEARSVYSVTTTDGQAKGAADVPGESPFPLPYKSNFQACAIGRSPPFFADQCGSFEIVLRHGSDGRCLGQVVTREGIEWDPGEGLVETVLGDGHWSNYRVSAGIHLLEPYSYAAILGRVTELHRSHGAPEGYWLKLRSSGAWELMAGTRSLAKGLSNCDAYQWHTLTLEMTGDLVRASLDGKEIAALHDSSYSIGMAGLGSSYNRVELDDVEIR